MRTGRFSKVRELFSFAVFEGVIRFRSARMHDYSKPAIIFAPHQDDETFGCGGLIAMKRERAVPVKVVFLTDGAGSHKHLSTSECEQLKAKRFTEAHSAGAVLGLRRDDLLFLDLPDGGLRQLSERQREEAIERIMSILKLFQPEEVYVPHRHDRHKDHEASFELVTTALKRSGLTAQILQYPIWLVWWSALGWRLRWRDLRGAKVLKIDGVLGKKRAAIEAYYSQHEILPKGFVKCFLLPREIFFAASGVKIYSKREL
jgi:LmbE family N-acetylglucosaminyl deacetylase